MRDTTMKKCGCPFMLMGVPLGGDMWKLEIVCGEHNHVIQNTLVAHSFAGRLKGYGKNIVNDLSFCGVELKQILTTLKQRDPDNLATMKTVYNVKAYFRLRDLEGRSIVQQLMKMLDEKHYVYYCRSNPNTYEITDIFWAYPYSILLVRCFPSMVMVDCTYKTNQYQLPILQIVENTSTPKTFCIALALLIKSFEVNMAMNEVTNNYMPLLPEFIWPFIIKVEDVKDDGNCGYRCVGLLMGYDEDNGWSKVRYDFHKEVLMHRGLYEIMFTKKVVEDVIGILNCHDSPSPPSKWMQMLKMGYMRPMYSSVK